MEVVRFFNLQQRITDSKQDSLSQEVLVELSSKAGANKGKQTDGSSRKHEGARAVFVKDGADDGATEEENEELVIRERIVSMDLNLLCFSFFMFCFNEQRDVGVSLCVLAYLNATNPSDG